MKKLAIIGRGTAGSFSVSHFLRWTKWDVDWYFDDNIKPQAVGEGTTLNTPGALFDNIGFSYQDIPKVDGSIKLGIEKVGWGKSQNSFYHDFSPTGYCSFHFNAHKLQNYILDKVKNNPRLTIKNVNVKTHDDIDAEYVLDCSGTPTSFDEFNISEYITVNATYVSQCFWEGPRFQYTIAVCRPYGWVFLIPLQNRCSVGYMYNNNFNTVEDIENDIKYIFKMYNLNPSDQINSFSFKNYYRKQNFNKRIAYNGNASFFLEPLEATSILTTNHIMRATWDLLNKNLDLDSCNNNYLKLIKDIENIIMIHYYAGSEFDTPFWHYAKERGENNMKECLSNNSFMEIVRQIKFEQDNNINHFYIPGEYSNLEYSSWGKNSWKTHIVNLNILDDLIKLKEKNLDIS